MEEISINGQKIGPKHKPYIVAELSANHNGSLDKALAAIEMIAHSGADAVKLQTYTPDTMTINSDAPDFCITEGLWQGYTLYDLYQQAQTPFEWHAPLFQKAKELGISIFSTPFDESAVELLESLDAPAYKIASFEATDISLIQRVAQTGKPLIISTGMANLAEITEAVAAAKDNGCQELVLLHCISSYPAPVEQANLATIADLAKRFNCVAGLSDHSLGTAVAVASIPLGACMIEKHVTLDRNDKGPDSEFSLEPAELVTLCQDTYTAWQAIGVAGYERKPAEALSAKFRRSLYFVKPLQAGATIAPSDIRRIRPGYGLAPKYFTEIIGKKVTQDIAGGTAVTWDLLE